jgi:hypothetical protein
MKRIIILGAAVIGLAGCGSSSPNHARAWSSSDRQQLETRLANTGLLQSVSEPAQKCLFGAIEAKFTPAELFRTSGGESESKHQENRRFADEATKRCIAEFPH